MGYLLSVASIAAEGSHFGEELLHGYFKVVGDEAELVGEP